MLVEKIPDDVLAEIQELQNRREKVENKITDLDKSIKARLDEKLCTRSRVIDVTARRHVN